MSAKKDGKQNRAFLVYLRCHCSSIVPLAYRPGSRPIEKDVLAVTLNRFESTQEAMTVEFTLQVNRLPSI